MIILAPGGPWCGSNAGGAACHTPAAQGFPVALVEIPRPKDWNWSDVHNWHWVGGQQEKQLLEYFIGPKWGPGGCYGGIDDETADAIEKIMRQSELTASLRVDRTKLKESEEAWVYMKLESYPQHIKQQLDEFCADLPPLPASAILTWRNSD
jgi:hypothetical protein